MTVVETPRRHRFGKYMLIGGTVATFGGWGLMVVGDRGNGGGFLGALQIFGLFVAAPGSVAAPVGAAVLLWRSRRRMTAVGVAFAIAGAAWDVWWTAIAVGAALDGEEWLMLISIAAFGIAALLLLPTAHNRFGLAILLAVWAIVASPIFVLGTAWFYPIDTLGVVTVGGLVASALSPPVRWLPAAIVVVVGATGVVVASYTWLKTVDTATGPPGFALFWFMFGFGWILYGARIVLLHRTPDVAEPTTQPT